MPLCGLYAKKTERHGQRFVSIPTAALWGGRSITNYKRNCQSDGSKEERE